MSTYTSLTYHIVFSTKYANKTLEKSNRERLYRFIWGIIKNKNSKLYQIGGVEDHIHILTEIRPSISVSSFIKDIKLSSNSFIKEEELFPSFENWQNGYGAFTVDKSRIAGLVNYIKNQEEHHKKIDFKEEYKQILHEHGVEFDEKYLL